MEMFQVRADGMMNGFMLLNDIEGRDKADGQIYSFCQVDPFIDDGRAIYDENIANGEEC